MKIRIEHVDTPEEAEVVIRCTEVDDTVRKLQEALLAQTAAAATPQITFYKLNPDTRQSEEYYFPLEDVLFFETENEQVWAHTANDAYRTRLRLYELEEALPGFFVRAAKSTIVNTHKIYAIKRDISQANQIQFAGTHKQVYASRRYYKHLKLRMSERS